MENLLGYIFNKFGSTTLISCSLEIVTCIFILPFKLSVIIYMQLVEAE